MATDIKCPKCNSTDVLFSKKWEEYICEDCRHAFKADAPFEPMRIFLSYGHDSNEELVCQIKADLEERGHDVWFDESEIKSGHDWRRSITEGIVDSNRVLSFLSKHSTRDPGVCLDEIAIAIGVKGGNIQTILVESEKEVKPPPSISHIQWLDMHEWKEKRAVGEAAWEKWYQAKLAEIVAVVESDESRRFAGEIRTLEEHLKPISSDSRIFQLLRKGLVGRGWLVEAIEEWRNAADRASRLFWIMGAPGVGKSAFAAHLAHYGRDKVIAVQFCEYDKPDHRNAHRIVRTLAFQIATRLPDYRKFLLALPEITELDRKNPSELFDYLLADPLRHAIDGGRERYLIVIDALDEAGEAGRNELVEMLAQNALRLPDWIGIVVTSRPESNVIAPLQDLNPFVLDTATESNRSDIRDYLRRELASHLQNCPDPDRLVEQILEKSEGVFLYVERFCDDVQRGHLSLDRPDQFPQGLGGIFFQYFQRQFPDLEEFRKDIRPALRAILAAREPLPLEILQRLFNWQDEELRDFTRPLSSFFPVTTEAGHEVTKPYHKSLTDWLVDELKAGAYFVSIAKGNELLAEACWTAYQAGVDAMDAYALRHALAHMGLAGRRDQRRILKQDREYQKARQDLLYGKWLMMRVYVCSTFRDMMAERDHMVHYVFPALRLALKRLRVHLVEVDLRWGITEEQADRGLALPITFAEIDNARPFFLCLMGERYGYVLEELPEDLVEFHPWLEGMAGKSVIELEVVHAVLRKPENHMHPLFFFRDPSFIADVPQRLRHQMDAEDDESRWKLARLKQEIHDVRSDAIRHYPCSWDPVAEQVAGFRDFGQMVYSGLWDAAVQELGRSADMLTEERWHYEHVEQHVRAFVGREEVVAELHRFCSETSDPGVCIVHGAEGVGKSAAIAKAVVGLRTDHPERVVIYHAAGASPKSATEAGMLEHLLMELQEWSTRTTDTHGSLEDLRCATIKLLQKACEEDPIVLIVDNVEWLDGVSRSGTMQWLWQNVPRRVRLVLGLRRPPDGVSKLFTSLAVLPFSGSEALEYLESAMAVFGKQMEPQQIGLVFEKAEACCPGYLAQLAYQIRRFGYFDRLSVFIQELHGYRHGLYEQMLSSFENDLGADFVRHFFQGFALPAGSCNLRSKSEHHLFAQMLYDAFPVEFSPPEDVMYLRSGILQEAITRRYGIEDNTEC